MVDLKKTKQNQNKKHPNTGFKALLHTAYGQNFKAK